MKWATFTPPGDPADRAGLVVGARLHALEPGLTLLDLLGDDGERLARAGERVGSSPADVFQLDAVRLRPPIPNPATFRDFYAFEQHVRTARRGRGLEMIPEWYQIPVFYFSNPGALLGSGDDLVVPPDCQELDFELEVAAVIGRAGANLTPGDAEHAIAGFTVLNDWSARDLQRREMRLGLGPAKGKDFATSVGPFLVTPDELAPYRGGRAYALEMTARVNGAEYSRGSLADLYWSFGEMISYASRGVWLRPGDLIGSGTCGTGCILEQSFSDSPGRYPWLRPGDQVELQVEHLGTLGNYVTNDPSRWRTSLPAVE
ncbi:MAG: fumarylacetoacetate hydrolase family protein [Chloroflexota bacterium]